MKWITSTDLKHWADTREAQSLLPELLLRLIRATSTDVNAYRFPCGDAIHLTGWDGVLDSNERIYNIEATIYCIRDSHKGIIIGKDGSMLKKIGTYAREAC